MSLGIMGAETETFVTSLSTSMPSVIKTPDTGRVGIGVFVRPAVGGLERDPGN